MTADHLTGRLRLFRTAWRAFLALGLAWAFLWPAPPPAQAAGGYLAVACLRRNSGQCGVINEKGDWVVEPAFDQIGDFAPNGRAVAFKRHRPGVIDARGEWVIPPGYDLVDEEWSAGLLKVGRAGWRDDPLYGLADEAGRLVVEPAFREIKPFGPNRLAGACDLEKRCGFIDTRGAWAVPPVFAQVENFAENGLAPARRPSEDLWGYINAGGEFVIPPAYEEAFPFEGDRAKVGSGGLYSLINSKGQAVGRNKFAALGDFDPGGLASAQKEVDGLFGLVNRAGAWVVPPRFERLFSFNGGNLAPAQKDGLFGFINRGGNWVIKPAFGNVDDFEGRGSRAPAERSGAWGLIDASGNWVVKPDYLLLLNSGGVYGPIQVFAENGRWGLMDENGRWLLEPILTASPYFAANGLSEAKVDGLYGFINRFGQWVVEPSFQQVGMFRPVPAIPRVIPETARPAAASPPEGHRFSAESASAAPKPKAQPPAPAPAPKARPPAPKPKARPKAAGTRRDQARQQPEPTRLVLPDKPSALGPAQADKAARPGRPKAVSEAVSTAPPTGYIPPADSVPARKTVPARKIVPARRAAPAPPAAPVQAEPEAVILTGPPAPRAEAGSPESAPAPGADTPDQPSRP